MRLEREKRRRRTMCVVVVGGRAEKREVCVV